MHSPTLIIIVGPTGVGKTETSLAVANHFKSDILSSDSRQVYKKMSIGTAAPSKEELEKVNHHFVQFLDPTDGYNASAYESDVLNLLPNLFQKNPVQVMVGGSMMYIDAVCKGIDRMPDVDLAIREELKEELQRNGIESLRIQLKQLDPVTYHKVDLKNPARILHAVEVCLTTGKPYSSFLTQTVQKRDFKILKVGLNLPRQELYDRINVRVELMIKAGLEKEVESLLPYRDCNALNTVGYKEMFDYLDGNISLKRAIALIQRNSRRYAKKQLTWFRKDEETEWFSPKQPEKVLRYIESKL